MSITHAYAYDAEGRQITDKTTTSGVVPTTTTDRMLYDGQNVIEERDGNGNVSTQYIWSGAGPTTLILRDSQTTPSSPGTSTFIPQITGAPLDQRLYAQDNGQGSITSLTSVGGAVQEREIYDQDGQPTSLTASWVPTSSTATSQTGDSQFNWAYLWHGGRYTKIVPYFTSSTTGLYSFGAGGSWYDSYHGIAIQPDFSGFGKTASPYDPWNGETGISGWFDRNAGTIATTIKIGSWFIPGGGPVIGFAVNGFADGYERSQNGQTLSQSIQGGAADVTGFTDIYGALTGRDSVTGDQNLWTEGQRIGHGLLGLIQMAPFIGALAKAVTPALSGGIRSAALAFSSAEASGNALAIAGGRGLALADAVSAAGGAIGGWSGIPAGLGGVGNTAFSIGRLDAEELAESGYAGNGEESDYRLGIKEEIEIHHIATDKNDAYTPLFQKVFQEAGMTLEDSLNKIPVLGHQGPHGDAYNWIVLDRLQTAVQNAAPNSQAYQDALQTELKSLAAEIQTRGSSLNEMVRFAG